MTGRQRPVLRHPVAAGLLVVALLAGHGAIVYVSSSRAALPTAVLAGVVLLLVHLGVLGRVYAWYRRYRPQRRRPGE